MAAPQTTGSASGSLCGRAPGLGPVPTGPGEGSALVLCQGAAGGRGLCGNGAGLVSLIFSAALRPSGRAAPGPLRLLPPPWSGDAVTFSLAFQGLEDDLEGFWERRGLNAEDVWL